MPTYLELKQQAEKLMAEAEQLRRKETQEVIADIKAKIKAYGLTAEDLGFGAAAAARKSSPRAAKAGRVPKAPKAAKAAKYRGPNGETWSGGRGRKPRWITEALASGKKLEDFEVR